MESINMRPLKIEITGTPNSGKTTLIKDLAKSLETKGFKVKIMQKDTELVPECIPKKTWARNTWITFGQLQSLIEITYLDCDIVLIERGYYDALFWSKSLFETGDCSKEQSTNMLEILTKLDLQFNFVPNLLLFIDVSVGKSIQRRRTLTEKGTQTLSNEEFLSFYQNEFRKFYTTISSQKAFLDTTHLTCDDARDWALNLILNDFAEVLF